MARNYRTYVIANPAASNGQDVKEWSFIQRLLRLVQREVEFVQTEHKGHATELTRQALRNGWELIVAVGGDGTLNEVINGFFEVPRPVELNSVKNGRGFKKPDPPEYINPNAVVGVIPMGSANDFCRSIGLLGGTSDSIKRLGSSDTRRIDLGQIIYTDSQSQPRTRYFLNASSAGLSAKLLKLSSHSAFRNMGIVRYFSAAATAFTLLPYYDVDIQLAQSHFQHHKLLALAVCNGQFFGTGMLGAPGADLHDGFYEILLIHALSRRETIKLLRSLYSGNHLSLNKVHYQRGRYLTAIPRPADTVVPVDCDGELLGRLPASWRIYKEAICFKI